VMQASTPPIYRSLRLETLDAFGLLQNLKDAPSA
jgi:hypothetical protein